MNVQFSVGMCDKRSHERIFRHESLWGAGADLFCNHVCFIVAAGSLNAHCAHVCLHLFDPGQGRHLVVTA